MLQSLEEAWRQGQEITLHQFDFSADALEIINIFMALEQPEDTSRDIALLSSLLDALDSLGNIGKVSASIDGEKHIFTITSLEEMGALKTFAQPFIAGHRYGR